LITFYATGEGQTNPPGSTGGITLPLQTSKGFLTPQPVAGAPLVTIGGKEATVLFYGESPGTIAGVMQVVVEIPVGLPAGNQPISVLLGDVSSRNGVTVAVK